MLKKIMDDGVGQAVRKNGCGLMFKLLVVFICGLLGVPVMAGEAPKNPQVKTDSIEGVVQRIQSRDDNGKRRDPFRPIKKRRFISSSSRKSQPEPSKTTPNPTIKDPNWKLLGIIHGQYGRQAVIQVSPGERIFVRPGLELVRSGWIIKTISDREVLLEHLSTTSSGTNLSQSRTFILSFPILGKLG